MACLRALCAPRFTSTIIFTCIRSPRVARTVTVPCKARQGLSHQGFATHPMVNAQLTPTTSSHTNVKVVIDLYIERKHERPGAGPGPDRARRGRDHQERRS